MLSSGISFNICLKNISDRLAKNGFKRDRDEKTSSRWILTLIDKIQNNIPHDRLILRAHGYGIRLLMKPSSIGESFIVFKI
jgi:hypothetical protein